MPKSVSEAKRARSVSLSLTAQEIFVLEMLAKRRLEEGGAKNVNLAVEAYREAIIFAGAQCEIYPYIYTEDGPKESLEFSAWLKEREWHENSNQKPTRYGGLYASLSSLSKKKRREAIQSQEQGKMFVQGE